MLPSSDEGDCPYNASNLKAGVLFLVLIMSEVVQQNPPSLSGAGQKDSPSFNLVKSWDKYPCFNSFLRAGSKVSKDSVVFRAGMRTTSHLSAIGAVSC